MPIGIWYWVFLIVAIVFGCIPREGPNARYWGWGGSLVWVILFILLGLRVFGSPIRG